MLEFTLKVKNDGKFIESNGNSLNDVAFRHLYPEDYCLSGEENEMLFLCELHGWRLEVERVALKE